MKLDALAPLRACIRVRSGRSRAYSQAACRPSTTPKVSTGRFCLLWARSSQAPVRDLSTGNYFVLGGKDSSPFDRLIYPVPEPSECSPRYPYGHISVTRIPMRLATSSRTCSVVLWQILRGLACTQHLIWQGARSSDRTSSALISHPSARWSQAPVVLVSLATICLFRISRRAAKNIVDTAARWIEDGDDWRYDVEPSRADSFYEAVSASLAHTRARVLRCIATLCTQPRVFRYAHTTRRWKMELSSRTTRATLSCSSLRLFVATDTSTRRSHSLTAVCCAMLGVCGPSFLRPGSQLPTFYFMIGAHTV